MAFRLGYCTLRWKNPDLEPALEALKAAGWNGWEGRLSLDWLGPPKRLRRICENAGMPMTIYTAGGSPDDRSWENVELNRRRMDYAAEMGVDCFMYMNGRKPENRPVSDDEIKSAAEGAEQWAEYAAQYGLELSYHIHTNLLVDSTEHWKKYMSHLDKARLCIDVSHAQLWGFDPVEAIKQFKDQLNYVHLQDYSSTSRGKDGEYLPVWCSVGEAVACDFPAIARALEEIGYDRWVTGCPGQMKPGREDALSMAIDSKAMYEYMRGAGY
jgi:sugar phosphate isomerase/epimerase